MNESRTLNVGSVTLRVSEQFDGYPELSHLGEYVDTPDTSGDYFTYSVKEGSVSADGYIWRDAQGRIESPPEHYAYARAYQYVRVSKDMGGKLAYAIQDAQRLTAHGNSWWTNVRGIEVLRNGHVIGAAYLGGVESDSGNAYLAEIDHDLRSEAIADARNTLAVA